MRSHILTFALVGFFVYTPFVMAAMNSTNYEIRWDTVSTGGSDSASSSNYALRDTLESVVAGSGSSTNYQNTSGYRAGIDDQIITFDVMAQSSSSVRSASSLSSMTVTTSTSSLSVGDMVALIQDYGVSQVTAIGRIASIGSGTITVDSWVNSGSTPSIDGTNDFVYLLSGTILGLGTLSTSAVTTAIVGLEVTAANDNGYVVQVFEDGNLRSGGNEINDVTDGSVTAGNEEYGARSSDTTLSGSTFDTADTAITSSLANVVTQSSAKYEDRNFLTFKAGIDQPTPDGSYSHTVSIIASGNF